MGVMKQPRRPTAVSNPPDTSPSDRLIGVPAVREHVGRVSRTTIWRWTRTEGFPKPVTIGGRHLWSEREVLAWIHRRLALRATTSDPEAA